MLLFNSLKTLHTKVLLLLCGIIFLTACSKTTEPKAGEYGQVKIAQYFTEQLQIKKLNAFTLPAPPSQKKPTFSIEYEMDSAQNPYRFVMVIKGRAIQKGKVKLRFLGGTGRTHSGEYSPVSYASDDNKTYDANEPVLLVISSDPFSANAKTNLTKDYFFTTAELTDRQNIHVDSIELQIWQGKGSKHSWVRYLGFVVFFLIGIMGFQRLSNVLTRR